MRISKVHDCSLCGDTTDCNNPKCRIPRKTLCEGCRAMIGSTSQRMRWFFLLANPDISIPYFLHRIVYFRTEITFTDISNKDGVSSH